MTPEQEARFRARYEAEQREARFRARYEAEQQEAAPVTSAATPSEIPAARQLSTWERARPYVAPALEMAGGLAGGVVGSALGPAGSIAGGALGYSGAKELTELADIYLGGKAPRQGAQAIVEPAVNLATGAAYEMGGPILNRLIVQPAVNIGGRAVGAFANILDPKSALLREAAEGKGREIVSALRA
ncbi:MAG: hypothetical protein JSU95_04480, partial [Betaproteobacteria bacterium]